MYENKINILYLDKMRIYSVNSFSNKNNYLFLYIMILSNQQHSHKYYYRVLYLARKMFDFSKYTSLEYGGNIFKIKKL